MGKRTDFTRRERDFYKTPPEAVVPLMNILEPGIVFAEPCAGDGALVHTLAKRGFVCGFMSDIGPQAPGINKLNLFDLAYPDVAACDVIITNTPWPARFKKGNPTVAMLMHLRRIKPTWALLSADFMHNVYFGRLEGFCEKIVSVGRVSWMWNGKAGYENAAWYLFNPLSVGRTVFIGRR